MRNSNVEIINEIRKARKQTLDVVEMAIGGKENWSLVRKQILKIFGNKGLEGNIVINDKRKGESNGFRRMHNHARRNFR